MTKESKNIKEEQENASIEETQANEAQAEEKQDSKPSAEELIQEEKDRYLRLFAEFENFKKRTAKERIELFKTANQDVLSALLPIVDDFDRGLAEIKKSEDQAALFEGMKLIHDKLIATLNQKGLVQVEVAAGDNFDADIHEAVTQIPAPDESLKGKIIDVIEKGYQLGEKIIRYPKVVIGQ